MDDLLWIFNWKGDGYNSVLASDRTEAIEKAKHLSRLTILEIDEPTLHEGTFEELGKLDRNYSGFY